jgi:lipopolysaccharide export system ATP-binding protein
MVTGLIQPNAGTVSFDDNTVTSWPMYRRARAGVGYLAQETSVFRNLNVADNIRLVLEAAGKSRKEIEATVERLLRELHIEKIAAQKGRVLSGGERRRVEIARALATEPKFILLDEPFTGIDPIAIAEIQGIVGRLKQKGIGVLITDHNVRETLQITDRSYILYDGQILVAGTSKELATNERAREIYLGEKFSL